MTEEKGENTHRKSQLIQLRLLLELKKICDENDIPFLIIGGTALGARRHQGFIPWDDDIDVGILGTEYPRFLKVMENLDFPCYLSKIDVKSNYHLLFSKLRLHGTLRVESGHYLSREEAGIDIDIFPYNNIPNNALLQKVYFKILSNLSKLYVYYCIPYRIRPGFFFEKCTFQRKVLREILYKISQNRISHRFLKKVIGTSLQKFSTLFNRFDTEHVLTVSAINLEHFRVPREDFLNPTPVIFEEHAFFAPGHLDDYLTNMYGDYMTIPPKDEQIIHPVMELDFGKYDDIDKWSLSELEKYPISRK